MIVDENLTTYIHSLESEDNETLSRLRLEAEADGVPIIRREMESFMRLLLSLRRPSSILEIGAAVCYSTIFMALNTPESCHITTIENYQERITAARKNLKDTSMEGRITLIEDDAVKVLRELDGNFDFIFLDAAKGQYITLLPDILRLLPEGGMLLADNVLQEGDIIKSRYATGRRQRTIHDRMRQFIWEVKHSDKLDTSVITIGDGVTLSIKK